MITSNHRACFIEYRPRHGPSHQRLRGTCIRESADPAVDRLPPSAAGLFFLIYALLIGTSRVLAGMHYPSDVLAGVGIGLLAAYLTTRLYRPLLSPAVRLVSRLTDPLLSTAVRLPGVSTLVLRPSVRATLVATVGVALLVRVGLGLRHHLFDEMELLTLAALAAVVIFGTSLAMRRYWPFTAAVETRSRKV